MANDWIIAKLGDVLEIKYGKDHKKLNDGDIPCFGSGGIMRYVEESLYEQESILIPRKGSLNNIYYVDQPFWTVDTLFWTKIKPETVFPKFLFYQLKLTDFVSLNVGSAVPSLTVPVLNDLTVTLPPLLEQKSIAHILSSLDDKIELNRQMNETLEAMAQALFKSWFVDFDPVIDNALAAGNAIPDELLDRAEQRKGIEKKDNSEIQDFFPDEFEFTEEMGWIPKGWGVGSLDKMFELQRGFDLPKKKRTDGIYPLMAASGQDGTHNEFKVKGPNVVTGRSGKLGVVSFVHTNHWPLNTTLWVKNYDKSNPYHAYFFLQTLDLERYNSGSAVPSLNRNNVHNLVQILPSKIVLDKFQEVVENNFAKIDKNNSGVETLAKLRDTLLPKLMSGELRIPDAAAMVEDV